MSQHSIFTSSGDSSVDRLDRLIDDCVPLFARPGEPPVFVAPTVPVTPEEAEGFLRAIDCGLFVVEPDGQCRPVGLRQGYYCYELLYRPSKARNEVRLWREWLTHAAVVARLHLDYGYPTDDLALDVDAFDVLVYSPTNQPLIAVEAKKTAGELEKMVSEMLELEPTGFELQWNQPKLSNAANKFRGLLALRPNFFLAVAPGVERAYAVRYPTDRAPKTLQLSQIERIPSAEHHGG